MKRAKKPYRKPLNIVQCKNESICISFAELKPHSVENIFSLDKAYFVQVL